MRTSGQSVIASPSRCPNEGPLLRCRSRVENILASITDAFAVLDPNWTITYPPSNRWIMTVYPAAASSGPASRFYSNRSRRKRWSSRSTNC